MSHPQDPQSNVSKFSGYHPDKYAIDDVSPTVKTDESITPGRPPALTQRTIAKFLQPLTRELVEIPPRPTIDELPDAVLENMVKKDKAFWIDKPGANAYTLHDAYYNYGMTADKILPPHQEVFPHSYQYDLDCVKYRRQNRSKKGDKDIKKDSQTSETTQKRWKYYPDLTATLSSQEIKKMMNKYENLHESFSKNRIKWNKYIVQKYYRYLNSEPVNSICVNFTRDAENVVVGRPYKNEACNWYYRNYPSVKYDCILRKFSK